MKRICISMVLAAGGMTQAMFGQQYPQQTPRQAPTYQGNPNYNGQYDNGQYAGDSNYDAYDQDPAYDDQGVNAPAPPPPPSYAYDRPSMPGPGYYWVGGYWNFLGGRYSWVRGYWMFPPYAGGYWVAPRYYGGRFFRGHWGGSRAYVGRGFVRNDYRYRGRVESFRSAPVPSHSFRGGDNRSRSGNRGHGR